MSETQHNTNLAVKSRCKWRPFLVASLLVALAVGCARRPSVLEPPEPSVSKGRLTRLGYSIQVGAFVHLNNAVRLSQMLQDRGLNAYYFVHKTGLYKVRFGDFPSRESARSKAKDLHAKGIISDFYIVGPEDYPGFKDRRKAEIYLRSEIVRTARSFVGIPYRWGGTSPERGFDCSGLSMVVYYLNGLNLPRSSREQWTAGSPVDRRQLSKADLVFFSASRDGRISHVGIYVGRGKFVHAPGAGKRVRVESLSSKYYKRRYVGAKRYL